MKTQGKVAGVNGNMVSVELNGHVTMNEVAYVVLGEKRLKAEVIRVRGSRAELQVFELTKGIAVGDLVEFSDDLLSVELGPGLLGKIYDGLQNPLPELAEQCGFFLDRGVYLDPLEEKKTWDFVPLAKVGDRVTAGLPLGQVKKDSLTTTS